MTAKIAISLPEELLEAADRESRKQGVSRSRFFADAVRLLLASEGERQAVARYVKGYAEAPESSEEAATAAAMLAVSPLMDEEIWE